MQPQRADGIWATTFRAAALAALVLGCTALGVGLLDDALSGSGYFWHNRAAISARVQLVAHVFGAAGFGAALVGGLVVALNRRFPDIATLLWRLTKIVSPIAPLSFTPILMRWPLWKDNDLIFLTLVLAVAWGLKVAVAAAIRSRPTEFFSLDNSSDQRTWAKLQVQIGRIPAWAWLSLVLLGVSAYCAWFCYHTLIWHRSARSGWDLSIEDNILWNILHGGHFFKCGPALGPTGSHFARHSAVVAYFLVPFYALYQSAEMVLILQTLLMGTAAIPLFLLGRRRVGAPLAALIALLYLMHPAVQESNLFEMHYIKLGTLPFWTTLWLLDARRYRAALVAGALTLMVREDVATWIVLLGAFGIVAGIQLRTSLTFLLGGLVYVAIVKFVIMPSLVHGHDELIFMYKDLLPEGKGSFAWAMLTALTNPAYVLNTLLTQEKLIYFLQILTPIVFIPLRHPIGWVALIPGIVFSFLSTHYSPLYDIHFQYSPHLLAMFYPALIVVLGMQIERAKLAVEGATARVQSAASAVTPWAGLCGSIAAMVVATLLCSSQYGAVIQQNTSRGGPIPYRFGWDEEGRNRHAALEQLLQILPKDASVAASAFTVTQISSREAAYSLSIDVYDSEYIIATTNRGELVPDEHRRLHQIFDAGTFGVVAIRKPFFLMKRGYSTAGNAEVRNLIR